MARDKGLLSERSPVQSIPKLAEEVSRILSDKQDRERLTSDEFRQVLWFIYVLLAEGRSKEEVAAQPAFKRLRSWVTELIEGVAEQVEKDRKSGTLKRAQSEGRLELLAAIVKRIDEGATKKEVITDLSATGLTKEAAANLFEIAENHGHAFGTGAETGTDRPSPKEVFRGFRLCREEIENVSVERLLLGIAKEANERGGLGKMQGKIFFEIEGYNEDQRELWEIPEVRAYFKKLDEVAPFFLYFLANEILGRTVRLYLKMFIDPNFFATDNPTPRVKARVTDFLNQRMEAITSYCNGVNSGETAKVDPREVFFKIYKCMGYQVTRKEVFAAH